MALLALGVFIGIIMALTGSGGGIIAVPLLVMLFGLTLQDAAPIALCAVALASGVGAILGFYRNELRYRAASLMAFAGIATAPIGLFIAPYISSTLLSSMFIGLLLWVSWKTVFQKKMQQGVDQKNYFVCEHDQTTARLIWTRRCAKILVVTGAITGFLSGLLGVGGGFIMVPALSRYTNLPVRSIIATVLCVAALVSLSAVVSSLWHGLLNIQLAALFSSGALIGLIVGEVIGSKVSDQFSRRLFVTLALVVALSMAFKLLLAR